MWAAQPNQGDSKVTISWSLELLSMKNCQRNYYWQFEVTGVIQVC